MMFCLHRNDEESLTVSAAGNPQETDDETMHSSDAESQSLLLQEVESCTTRFASGPALPQQSVQAEAPPCDPRPRVSIDSSSFWKSCNAAGCTQAIITDFIRMLNDISNRIQADQASQGDYNLALSVMEASGKLTEFVDKQQKELKRKQTELMKAVAAMEDVVTAVRR
ncbi:uncharacterized protein LOC131455613 isoform X2 [Solea solea]|uniref:uncharacterized protein LOC131455613 isoform X2 n=1 Tax=Solea solea TaxID=90069 RepID=UPI00272CBCF0|nr:uncharacterized protein LOC131455613 isoform X2 [Solea solea]